MAKNRLPILDANVPQPGFATQEEVLKENERRKAYNAEQAELEMFEKPSLVEKLIAGIKKLTQPKTHNGQSKVR